MLEEKNVETNSKFQPSDSFSTDSSRLRQRLIYYGLCMNYQLKSTKIYFTVTVNKTLIYL